VSRQAAFSAHPERPIRRGAADLVRRLGLDAPFYAEQSFGLAMERGDFPGATYWCRVYGAIEELLSDATGTAARNC